MFSKWKDIYSRLAGKGIYPHEMAFLLDTPIRKLILSPKQLIKRLNLSRDFNVLEIGPGPGYFSIDVAECIPYGKLIMYDIQIEMLYKCRKKLNEYKINNAFLVQGNAANLPFSKPLFDVVFMVTVLGEISEPDKFMISVNNVLRKGGTLSVTEMKGDADVLKENDITNLVKKYGFLFSQKFQSSKGFTVNYIKDFDIVDFQK